MKKIWMLLTLAFGLLVTGCAENQTDEISNPTETNSPIQTTQTTSDTKTTSFSESTTTSIVFKTEKTSESTTSTAFKTIPVSETLEVFTASETIQTTAITATSTEKAEPEIITETDFFFESVIPTEPLETPEPFSEELPDPPENIPENPLKDQIVTEPPQIIILPNDDPDVIQFPIIPID